jgi:hypothetical protein
MSLLDEIAAAAANHAHIYTVAFGTGFDSALRQAKLIVRHERSSITDAEVQQVLDRILKAVEEIEIKPKIEKPEGTTDGTHQEKSEG